MLKLETRISDEDCNWPMYGSSNRIRDITDHGQNGPRPKRTKLGTKRTTFWDKTDRALGQNGPCMGHTRPSDL